MGAIRSAINDAVVTSLWMFSVSTLAAATGIISSHFRLSGPYHSVSIFAALFALLLFVFEIVSAAIGGASFNPTGNAAMYAAGHGEDTLFSMALRIPAQAIGAIGGTLAIMEAMPPKYKHTLSGPALKVDLHTGAMAEGVLTFLMTLSVLLICIKGPGNAIIRVSMLAISTVALIVTGSNYTGPSMNPANAYGWAYHDKSHNTWQHFYIYWISPFIGAILAAWVFRFIFPPPSRKPKVKKA
ncbi:aquaporin SIP1-2 [Iris pallida]|uniref:Aquaporin SIP1-2 n=1 Tax=Iris pallida TaxID=29817 RepID=A0AAX6GP50_IRIPA|nr:aquaporin SIP1-2 [Iris pallida]